MPYIAPDHVREVRSRAPLWRGATKKQTYNSDPLKLNIKIADRAHKSSVSDAYALHTTALCAMCTISLWNGVRARRRREYIENERTCGVHNTHPNTQGFCVVFLYIQCVDSHKNRQQSRDEIETRAHTNKQKQNKNTHTHTHGIASHHTHQFRGAKKADRTRDRVRAVCPRNAAKPAQQVVFLLWRTHAPS